MTPFAARARRAAAAGGHATVLVFFVTFLAFPFYWMLITTFKTTQDLYNTANNPYMFNDPPTLHHLQVLFGDTQYLQWLANTAFVGVAVVVITLVLAVPAGYALARMTGAWAQNLGIAIFLTYLVPPTILFIPFSRIIAMLGLQELVVVPGARLPQLHGAILYLAADGFLQGDTARARGRGDDRRLEPARRVHQSGRPNFRCRDVDGSYLRLHVGDAGVRLRRDVHHLLGELHGKRRRADLPGARRRVFLGFDDGRLPHRERTDCCNLQLVR